MRGGVAADWGLRSGEVSSPTFGSKSSEGLRPIVRLRSGKEPTTTFSSKFSEGSRTIAEPMLCTVTSPAPRSKFSEVTRPTVELRSCTASSPTLGYEEDQNNESVHGHAEGHRRRGTYGEP